MAKVPLHEQLAAHLAEQSQLARSETVGQLPPDARAALNPVLHEATVARGQQLAEARAVRQKGDAEQYKQVLENLDTNAQVHDAAELEAHIASSEGGYEGASRDKSESISPAVGEYGFNKSQLTRAAEAMAQFGKPAEQSLTEQFGKPQEIDLQVGDGRRGLIYKAKPRSAGPLTEQFGVGQKVDLSGGARGAVYGRKGESNTPARRDGLQKDRPDNPDSNQAEVYD